MKLVYQILAAGLFCAAVASAQPKVSDVTLDAAQVFGNCKPSRVHFNGRITASGPMDVTYRWRSSGDGKPADTRVLHFVRAGTLGVSNDWMFTKAATGWVALQIVSPAARESRHVDFTVACKP